MKMSIVLESPNSYGLIQ